MYLSHLRKTEIWNFSSVLRILWNEFRNYLGIYKTEDVKSSYSYFDAIISL